jgi:hypothetical protein
LKRGNGKRRKGKGYERGKSQIGAWRIGKQLNEGDGKAEKKRLPCPPVTKS